MTDYDAIAAELLPCISEEHGYCHDGNKRASVGHLDCCPARYRPAVAQRMRDLVAEKDAEIAHVKEVELPRKIEAVTQAIKAERDKHWTKLNDDQRMSDAAFYSDMIKRAEGERDNLRDLVAEKDKRIVELEDGTDRRRLLAERYGARSACVEKDKEIARLEQHLPDCCKAETCGEDDGIVVGDVVAQTMNTLPKEIKITTDQYIDLSDKIGDLAHKAVKAAIKNREAALAALRRNLAAKGG